MDKLLQFYDNRSYVEQDDLKRRYREASNEEAEVSKRLEDLYCEKSALGDRLSDLSKSINDMSTISSVAEELTVAIRDVSDVAVSINNKMKRITTGLNNVQTCQSRVRDLLNLQSCSDAVQKALQTEDYESAAGHVHNFLTTTDRQLWPLSLTTESEDDHHDGDNKPIVNSVKLLQDATVMLQNKISLHFKEAVGVGDSASVERFFKLFLLVGMRDYGLSQYASFLCSKLVDFQRNKLTAELKSGLKRNNSSMIFADVMTLLFEEIARILESNQPIVETYCGGAGCILSIFLPLQKECDTRASYLMSEFNKVRQLDTIVQTINEYSSSATTRGLGNVSGNNISNSNITSGGSGGHQTGKSEKMDAKNIDTLLDEIATIHSRYQLYRKFVSKKITADLDIVVGDEEAKRADAEYRMFETTFNRSVTCRRMQELICDYLVLEKYYMEENTKLAIASDQLEEDDDSQMTTSLIDDAFFIVRKCIRRANLSGSLDAVCAVINNACAILETDVCNAMRRKLKQGYASGYLDLTQAYNVVMQGRLQQQSDYEQTRSLFLGHLNNSETCDRYIDMLLQSLKEEIRCSQAEQQKLDSCLSGLTAVRGAFKSLNEYGLQQLRVTVVKSRVVPWIDAFLSYGHQLETEEEFSSYQADDPFVRKLIADLQGLLSEFKPRLTSANYESLVSIIVAEVAGQLEKDILKSEFSRMGGLALDKEIRTLVGYLSRATSWSVRDKFARLIQMATVLNLEKVSEIAEYCNVNSSGIVGGGAQWQLTPKEIRQVLSLRKDFRSEDIKRLQF